jgi:hypothetical protein
MWAHRTVLTSIQSGIIDCQERLSQLRRSKPLPWRSKARLEKAQMVLPFSAVRCAWTCSALVFSCMGRDISRCVPLMPVYDLIRGLKPDGGLTPHDTKDAQTPDTLR